MTSALAHTRATPRARAFWTAVHRMAGLITALFLFMAGLTGAIISWDHELDEWLNPDLYRVASRGPYRPAAEMASAIQRWDSRVVPTYWSLSYEEGHSAVFFVRALKDPTTGRVPTLDYNQVFVDPVTAKVLGRRDSRAVSLSTRKLMPFLRKLHYTLHVPPFWGSDRWGYWIMGGVALIWLLDSMVGLYLTLPARPRRQTLTPGARRFMARWAPAWKIKAGAARYRLHFDLHRAVGLWIWIVLIVLAFTSFSLNLRQEVFFPMLSLVSKTTPRLESHLPKAPLGTVLEARHGFEAVMDTARQEAARRGWTTPMSGIFYNARYGFYNVSFFDRSVGGDASNMSLSNLYIDGRDLRVLTANEPWVGTAADVFAQLQLPLHSGRIFGTVGRVVMSVVGLLVAGLSVTGLLIWWRKRGARRAAVRHRTSPWRAASS
jgi:uncharacterized iron-regulated membrane protein